MGGLTRFQPQAHNVWGSATKSSFPGLTLADPLAYPDADLHVPSSSDFSFPPSLLNGLFRVFLPVSGQVPFLLAV